MGREPSIKLCGFTFSYFNLFVTFDLNFPVTPGGGGGEGGYSTNIWAGCLGISLSPPACLGRKNPKIHTLFRTTPTNLLPCLGQRTKLDCDRPFETR